MNSVLRCPICKESYNIQQQKNFERNILSDEPLKSIDVIAYVTNQRATKTAFAPQYHGCCEVKRNYQTSSIIKTINGESVCYEQSSLAEVSFLSPKVYPATLWMGKVLELYEGKRLVGTLKIVEIRNPILDRSRVFKDRPDVLSDTYILNIALRHEIEWGKEFGNPLQNKLMHYIPTLSGNDIEKVSAYIQDVANDVIWHIYYDNYDFETQSFSIDAAVATMEKYPWITPKNLNALNNQGMYYSWHG